MILVTDGEESCHGDPKAAVQKLKDSGIDVTVNIVGFTLTGKEVQQQLSELAQSTGGRYYTAENGDALARALLLAAREKFPYAIYDAGGNEVAKGETGPLAEALPPGEYKVTVRAGDQELVKDHVKVALNSDTIIKVTPQEDHFVLLEEASRTPPPGASPAPSAAGSPVPAR